MIQYQFYGTDHLPSDGSTISIEHLWKEKCSLKHRTQRTPLFRFELDDTVGDGDATALKYSQRINQRYSIIVRIGATVP